MVTTDFKAGAPNWLDLGSPDIPAAVTFYSSVFGWTFESAGPDAGGYGFFQAGGKTVAGIGQLTEEGASSAWTVYFMTSDADAVAKGVEQAGGTVRLAPSDVMEAGRMAQFTDPTGAQFAIWQPGQVKGLDVIGEPGAFIWAELHSGDTAAALDFYRSLFGWRTADSGLPGIEYTILSTAEGEGREADFGGAAGLFGENARPGWLPHFAVTDADAVVARTREGGGSVLMGPDDIPSVGRIAVMADPFGAQFAVIKPTPPQA